MSDYLADIQRYDASADADTVKKIVRYLGIALRNRDASMVSCSDDSELERIRQKWCGKKLGTDGKAAEGAVMKVCETMKADRSKARVTFYYLVAKELNKLATI